MSVEEKKVNKYSEGKIYKIVNKKDNNIYVGSTINSIFTRFSTHKSNSNNDKIKYVNKLYNLTVTSEDQLAQAAAAEQSQEVGITFPPTDYLCVTQNCGEDSLNLTVTSEDQLAQAAAAEQSQEVGITFPPTDYLCVTQNCIA